MKAWQSGDDAFGSFANSGSKARMKSRGFKRTMALWRQTARIAAVAEHDEWILSLEQELNAADSTAKTLGVQEDSQRKKFVDLASADGASAIASAASGGSQSHFTPTWAALSAPACRRDL